jgi:hypothetical protein
MDTGDRPVAGLIMPAIARRIMRASPEQWSPMALNNTLW